MKWFKRNIGDELLAVGRLPALQRGIYWSLELYYKGDETGLVVDLQELAAMAGVNVRKKGEREALEGVLRRFFVLGDDGRHHRADWDRAVAAYQRGAPAEDDAQEEGSQSSGAERQRRYRERKRRRKALSDIGMPVQADASLEELRALCVQHLGETASAALGETEASGDTDGVTPVTSRVTPVTQPLKPVTTTHEPTSTPTAPGEATAGVGGGEGDGVTPCVTAAVTPLREASRSHAVRSVAAELTAQGLLVHHTDGDLQRLVSAGWTAQAILDQAPRAGWSSVKAPMAWLAGKVANRSATALPAPDSPGAPGGWPQTRSGVEAIGIEAGLGKWDEAAFYAQRGESFAEYEARVKRAAGCELEAVA